jgi:homoserine dehydrogenase
VVLISRSSKSLISNDYSPINLENWQSAMTSSSAPAPSVSEVLNYLTKSPLPAILVDNTSNETWARAYPEFLSKSISVVTPNKKAFSSDIELWDSIFNKAVQGTRGLVYHEATVGAGLPIISTLKDLVATGDKIHRIEGTFSGSLGFIFNQFSPIGGSDLKFSDIVNVAKQNGYTEPDPREDLNGLDVARKVTILSRLSGYLVEGPSSFPVDSLIPKELESIESAADFMAKLPDFDEHFDRLRKEAYSEKKVLRYVGKVDLTGSGSVKVGIEKYDFSHPFANLPETDNVISFKTERYPSNLIVQGSGAGGAVTAAGVFADIIKVTERVGA